MQAELPLIVTLNVRFTRGSRAYMAMQRHDPTGYIEIWTARGVEGNSVFHRRLEELANDSTFNAVPHWGHFHQRHAAGRNFDFEAAYPLSLWRQQLRRLRRKELAVDPFVHGFARDRGLF